MRVATGFLYICLAMAALAAASKLLAVVAIGLALARPLATLQLLTGLVAIGILIRHPLAAILTIGAAAVAIQMSRKAKP